MKSGYVSLIGATNVGKSTLLNAVLGEKISITSPKPNTTQRRVLGVYHGTDSQVVFLDVPGVHEVEDTFNAMLVSMALSALNDADILCIVIEAGARPRRRDLTIVRNVVAGANKPVVLVINKIDTVKDKRLLLPLIESYRTVYAFHAIVPISALTGDGIGELLGVLESLLPEGPKYFDDETLTDLPVRTLVGELVREQIFHHTHEEIPYAVFVSVDHFPSLPEGSRGNVPIEVTIHVERDSQKGVIIGKGGRMLRKIREGAEESIERLLRRPVSLRLFVRVQERWRRDSNVLHEWGFPVVTTKDMR